MLKLCKINACPNGTLGIHLSRAPYDPYPWVSGVLENSSAYQSGIRISDTVLECNGTDVLGWKISELAIKIRNHWDSGGKTVNFLIWRNKTDGNVTTPAINQQSLQKFATCLQNIAQLLECPICLEVIKPPGWQCCNGHVLCNSCRNRSVKCPVCRVPFGPRGRCLLSDKLFTLLAETFPCDGSRNGDNKNGRCPQDNHKIKKNNNISKKSTPAIQQTSSPQQSTQYLQQNIETSLQPSTISYPQPTIPTLFSQENNNNDNETVHASTMTTTSTLTTTTITTTRVIAVGDETRTSPVKIRNNRNLSNLVIPTAIPISQNESLVAATATATIIESPIQVVIKSDQQQQQQQELSTISKRIISLPITTNDQTLLNNTITSLTSTVASLKPIISTDTTTTEHKQSNEKKNFISSYRSSTNLNPNINDSITDGIKNIKQIITLKVKSKSSENLELLSAKKINNENIESDKKELQERPQALSLPASPVSNLVSSKKNHKTTLTTTRITSGYDISLQAASQRNNKNSSSTTTTTSNLSKKSDTEVTVYPSDSLLSDLMLVYKSYHCPTGKSTCIIKEIDEFFLSTLPSSLISTKFQHQKELPTSTSASTSASASTSTLNTTLFRKTIKDDKNYLCKESHCCCSCCYCCCSSCIQYENKMILNHKRDSIEEIQRDQLNIHLEKSSKELCKNLNIKKDINNLEKTNNYCNSCCNNVNVMNYNCFEKGKTNDDNEKIKAITSASPSPSPSSSNSNLKPNLNENHHNSFNLNDIEIENDIREDIKLQVHLRLLNHLRSNHKIPLCQYHCGFNEKIPIDFNMMMKEKYNKSNILMCISIDNNQIQVNGIDRPESPLNFISLPTTILSSKSSRFISKTIEKNNTNNISSSEHFYSNSSPYFNQKFSIPTIIVPVITHNNEDDSNRIIKNQSNIIESSLSSSSPSTSSNIIMNNSNKIKIDENPIEMTTSLKTIKESIQNNTTSSTRNILKGIKNSLIRFDSYQTTISPQQTNKISIENINKLQNSIKNSSENSNGKLHFNNFSKITSSLSNNHQHPQTYRQVYQKRSFESCSDLNSKKFISELNSKNFIDDALSASSSSSSSSSSRSKLSTIETTKTITTATTDKTLSQFPIHYNKKKKNLKSFSTSNCIGTNIGASSKNYFITELNTNQKIPNSIEYKISIECIEKIRIKTELFFIIKIPLKNYKEMYFCNKCNTINTNNTTNTNNNNNDNNKNCKNIKENFLFEKHHNNNICMDISGEQINSIDKEYKMSGSVDDYKKKNNIKNSNDINDIRGQEQQQQQHLETTEQQKQEKKDIHVLHDLKINQNINLINSQIFEKPTTTFSNDMKFSRLQNQYPYNSYHNNLIQQFEKDNLNGNLENKIIENIYKEKNRYNNNCNINPIEKRAVNLKNSIESLDNENNKFYCSKCCSNCIIPRTSILNSSYKINSPQFLNDVTYCCNKICNSNNNNNNNNNSIKNCNNTTNNNKKYYCNNIEYKNYNKKKKNISAIFIWYCGSDYELNVKNFRAVIECCNIIKKRDNNSTDIMNINNIININDNKNNINNDDNDNDDDNDDYNDDDKKNNQKFIWNSNNKIKIVTNKNLNNANKCIHEENIKNVKSSIINSSKLSSSSSSSSILPILPISSSSSSLSSNDNKKIPLWIHPITKSWNCIRKHMQFNLLDENSNDEDDDDDDDEIDEIDENDVNNV